MTKHLTKGIILSLGGLLLLTPRCLGFATATAEVKLGVEFTTNPNFLITILDSQFICVTNGFGNHSERVGGEVNGFTGNLEDLCNKSSGLSTSSSQLSNPLLYQQNYFAESNADSPPDSQSLASVAVKPGLFAKVENLTNQEQTLTLKAFVDFFGIASTSKSKESAGFQYSFEASGGLFEADEEEPVNSITLFKTSGQEVSPPDVTAAYTVENTYQIKIAAGREYGFTLDSSNIGTVANSKTVPEPLTLLGTITAIGFGVIFRKQREM